MSELKPPTTDCPGCGCLWFALTSTSRGLHIYWRCEECGYLVDQESRQRIPPLWPGKQDHGGTP